MNAYRQADTAAAEVQALRDRLARREAGGDHDAEDLYAKLTAAQREARRHQAAANVAEEALEQAHSEAQQVGIRRR